MRTAVRPVLFVTFAATGFSALTLQVVWQRVISLHAGIDLIAATTVVTAFLAGSPSASRSSTSASSTPSGATTPTLSPACSPST